MRTKRPTTSDTAERGRTTSHTNHDTGEPPNDLGPATDQPPSQNGDVTAQVTNAGAGMAEAFGDLKLEDGTGDDAPPEPVDDGVRVEGAKTILTYENFDDMSLKVDLLRGVYGYGFEKPSVIQKKAIVPIVSGIDVIAQAQSGTGKTATFGIAALQRLELGNNLRDRVQIIIVSPTRELTQQHANVMLSLGEYLMPELKVHICTGGGRVAIDRQNLRRNMPNVIVATPGRLNQHLNEGTIDPNYVKMFILDEADVLISRGFEEQIYSIFRMLPADMQVVLCSATMPPEALEITQRFMRDPTTILVKKDELTLEGIRQFYIDVGSPHHKFETLDLLYNEINVCQSVIFVNQRRGADQLGALLAQENHQCSIIHAQLEAEERKAIMSAFKQGSTRVLITTDLLARGIDVQQISLVINYDLPIDRETYIHRIGRSGRFGRKGVAINFVAGHRDHEMVQELRQHYSTAIEELPDYIADIIN